MPLKDGITRFDGDIWFVSVNREALLTMLRASEAILAFYRKHPTLLIKPYELDVIGVQRKIVIRTGDKAAGIREVSRFENIATDFVADSCCNNPIYAMLCDAGVGPEHINTSSTASAFDWKGVEFASGLDAEDEIAGYSLVDLSVYLVWLLNIHQPNRSLIANLIATNVMHDALGRENVVPAVRAISKLVIKTLGQSSTFIPAEAVAEDIFAISRAGSPIIRRQGSDGVAFERDCARLLEAGGFVVRTTPTSGDYGADLIAEKDDLGYAIQCKDTSKPVGVKAVQEAIGARRHYSVDYAVVCASAGFTDAAIELATSNKVVLCNADQLVRRLESI